MTAETNESKGRPVGRPRSKKERKTLCIALDVPVYDRLEQIAEANHMTKAAVLCYRILHSRAGLSDVSVQEGEF